MNLDRYRVKLVWMFVLVAGRDLQEELDPKVTREEKEEKDPREAWDHREEAENKEPWDHRG